MGAGPAPGVCVMKKPCRTVHIADSHWTLGRVNEAPCGISMAACEAGMVLVSILHQEAEI